MAHPPAAVPASHSGKPATPLRTRYIALLAAYRTDAEMLDFIDSRAEAVTAYQEHVVAMDRRVPMQKLRMEPQDFVPWLERQDHIRRDRHERAISATARLNILCDAASIPRIFDGDTSDRYAVAAFAGELHKEFYEHGRSRPRVPEPTQTVTLSVESPTAQTETPHTTPSPSADWGIDL